MKKIITLLALVVFSSTKMVAINYYWVGGSGNWSDFNNHWATTSGGSTFHNQVPQSTDNVFFDVLSFTASGQTVTVDQTIVQFNDMTWTGVTHTPVLNGANTLKIYGSLTLVTGMAFNFNGNVNFEATTTGKTITSAGTSFGYSTVVFNGTGGGWTLQDSISANTIYLNNGILNTNNKTINASTFYSYGNAPRTLIAGTSTFNMSGNYVFYINSVGMTMNAASSIIKATTLNQQFIGGGLIYNDLFFTGTGQVSDSYNTFHNVSFASDGLIQMNNTAYNVSFGGNGNIYGGGFHDVAFGANATIMYGATFNNVSITKNGTIGGGNNTFNNLSFAPGYTYTLEAGKTQTISNSFTVNGNCGAMISIIKSSAIGSQATISKASGAITASFVVLKDINATGGATFTANNAIDLGNNTGWTINTLPSKNLYWIGNGGNWDDSNHWAITSGGSPSGCSPTPMDNVFFDANSFSTAGQTVMINIQTAYCNNMTWTGVTNVPSISGSTTLKIYGSLTLVTGMEFNFNGNVNFEAATTGKTIITAGKSFGYSTLVFNGTGGGWTLQDSISANIIYLNNGTLNTNNKTINTSSFYSYGNSPRALIAGTSNFNMSGAYVFYLNSTGMTLSAASSVIRGIGTGQQFIGGGLIYNDLFFTGSGQVSDSYNTFHNVSFASDGLIQYDNTAFNVSFGGSGSIYGGSFHNVAFGANATILYGATFNNVSIAKNANIGSGSSTFNNLSFSPGYTYTLGASQTQTVENICAQGTGALPIRIQSSTVGTPAIISKTTGTICWDYVHVSDITGTGGATFNAGLAPANSEDMGGNTGLLFTGSCTFVSCTSCPSPVITAQPGNNNICAGSNTVFAMAATGTDLTYQWQVNDGTGFTNLSNTATYSGVTTNTLNITEAAIALNGYLYQCVVNSSCAPVSLSNSALLTVNALPIVTISSGTITCNGSTTMVTVSANGGIAPYTGTGNFPVTAGTYNYTVTDTNGCAANTTITLTEPPVLLVSASENSTTVTVSATGGTPPYTGTGIFTKTSGSYAYSYTVTDNNGCIASSDNKPRCGLTNEFIYSLSNKRLSDDLTKKSNDAPQTASVDCGRFHLVFDDETLLDGYGFDNPTNGAAFRQCACDVVNYIQSVFQIPAGDGSQIEIFFDQSWKNPTNPPPSQNINSLAVGGPFFTSSNFQDSTAGFYGGNVFDHFTTGIDPDTNSIDGHITVNFNYQFRSCNEPRNCGTFDLYSVLLHEFTHTLGWFSGIKENLAFFPESNWGSNRYTNYDQFFLYHGNIAGGPLTHIIDATNPSNPIVNPTILANALTSQKVWLTNVVQHDATQNQNSPIWGIAAALTGSAPPNTISHFRN